MNYNLGKMSPASKAAGSIYAFSRGFNPLLKALALFNDGASPLLKCIIFDYDYTLGDCTSGIIKAARYSLGRLGVQENISDDKIRRTIGLTLYESYHYLTEDESEDNAESYRLYFVEEADRSMTDSAKWLAFAKETLIKLKQMGILVAICTTKYQRRIDAILKNDNAVDLVDYIVGSDMVKFPKPNPESVNKILEYFNLSPTQALYVGDSVVDAKTALSVKMDFVGVLTGTTTRAEMSNYPNIALIENLGDLFSVI